MDRLTPVRARRLAIIATCATALVVVAAIYTALWRPGMLDLSSTQRAQGPRVVTWVAPDGPAWNAGVARGATIVRGRHGGTGTSNLLVRQGTRLMDLSVAALGLGVILFGVFILTKGRGEDRRAARAFWRMSTLLGLALGVVPAGFHGVPWAIALSFVALTLFGPALLDMTLVFPHAETQLRRRVLLWLPVGVPLLLYPVCWWRPVPLFSLVATIGDTLLVGYIVGACARLAWLWTHPHSEPQRAQFQWLALGLILGFMPLALFDLLPYVLTGHYLLAPQVSILALALLPLCIGIAIVRTEAFGITSLMRRRTLRALVIAVLLVGVAVVAGSVASLRAQRWEWPAPATAAGASVLTALAALSARPWLTRRAERALFHDVYDPADVVLRVSADLSHALPHTLGPLIVTHLVTIFDLDFALLLTANDYYLHAHARSTVPVATLERVTQHARALLAAPSPVHPIMDDVAGIPLLVLPIGDSQRVQAIVCCGPKHSGDCYTRQDRSLLYALGHDLTARFHLQTQLDEQTALLRALQEANASSALRIGAPATQSDTMADEPLTRSELRVLIHLAQGMNNKEIAERLDRDHTTIEKHLKSIRHKVGVYAVPDLVAVARQRGLLPSE